MRHPLLNTPARTRAQRQGTTLTPEALREDPMYQTVELVKALRDATPVEIAILLELAEIEDHIDMDFDNDSQGPTT